MNRSLLHLAMGLVGIFLFVGLSSLDETPDKPFREALKVQANAEESPLAYAFLVARRIQGRDMFFVKKNRALYRIAIKYADAGRYDEALRVAEIVDHAGTIGSAERDIALKLAEAGLYDRALQITASMEPGWWKREMALAGIVSRLAEAGQYDRALEVAKTIQDDVFKDSALGEIADRLAKAGQTDRAADILSQAPQLARAPEHSPTNEGSISAFQDDEVDVLAEIADKYAEAGLYDQALQIIEAITDSSVKAIAFVETMLRYAEAGRQVEDKVRKILQGILREVE